jgi:cyclase
MNPSNMKQNLAFFLIVILLAIDSIQAQEWRHLFNGKDLSGWEQIGPGEFVVEDSIMKTVGGMGMILYPAEKFSDVVIRVVYTVKDNDCNSGVFIRLPEKPTDPWAAVNTGYEVQIDNGTRHVGGDFHCTGVLYSLTRAMAHPQKNPGEWNTIEITLDGLKTIVHINGIKVTEYNEGDEVPPKVREFEPDRGPRPAAGYIGLQNHDPESTVYFKEVAVKSIINLCAYTQTFQSKHFSIQKLTDGVYAAIAKNGGYAICNAGIVDLGDATLIFDTFMSPEAAADLKKAASQLTGHPIKYVINSHYHNDHIGGNQIFDGADIISTEYTRELIAINQPEEIADSKISAPLQLEKIKNIDTSTMTPHEFEEYIMWKGYLEAIVTSIDSLKTILPNLTFNDRLLLYGTKRQVQLLSYGEGHTKSDLFLYLPDEQLAFLGDLLFIQNQPWLSDGDPDKWKTYLDSIALLNVKTLIPGHGPIGTVSDIEPMILYMQNVNEVATSYYKKGILPQNDATLKSPPPFDTWTLSNFYKPNIISVYNCISKKKVRN